MLHYRWTTIFGRDRGWMHRRMHQLSPSTRKIYVCLQTHWNQTYILWDQDVDLCRTRYGFCWLVQWTCQGVVVPRNAFASNQKDRPSEYFRENLPSLCPYLVDCKNKDTPRVNQSLPLKVMTWNTSSDRLECLLMRTLWRPRSIRGCITHARSFTSTFRVH